MQFTRVVFDFDGTIADTGQGIFESVEYALRKMGLPPASEETKRRFIGPPLMFSFQNFIGLSEQDANQAVLYYRENYAADGKYKLRFYDGIPELLRTLRGAGFVTCLASAKPDRFIREILDHFDANDWFDYAEGMPMQAQSADKSGIIQSVLAHTGADGSSADLMIGDTKYDILSAKKIGLSALGVLYGYGSAQEMRDAGADYLADSAKEIRNILISDK